MNLIMRNKKYTTQQNGTHSRPCSENKELSMQIKKWFSILLLFSFLVISFGVKPVKAGWVLVSYFQDDSWDHRVNGINTYCQVQSWTWELWGPNCTNEIDYGYYKVWWENVYGYCVGWTGGFFGGCVPAPSSISNTLFTYRMIVSIKVPDIKKHEANPADEPKFCPVNITKRRYQQPNRFYHRRKRGKRRRPGVQHTL